MEQSVKYLLAIDQSTSATKTMLFNRQAELVERVTLPHKQYYPQDGFVEHDADEIFANTLAGIKELLAKAGVQESELAGIAITNQRETAMI